MVALIAISSHIDISGLIDCHDLVEFAYSIYNSIIDTNADEQTKNNLIDLAIKSLLAATQTVKIDNKKINYINILSCYIYSNQLKIKIR